MNNYLFKKLFSPIFSNLSKLVVVIKGSLSLNETQISFLTLGVAVAVKANTGTYMYNNIINNNARPFTNKRLTLGIASLIEPSLR